MTSTYDLKPRFQALLRPLCRRLHRAGVTANAVTLAAVGLSAAGGAAIACRPAAAWPLLALPVVLLVRMALNAVDGMLAREHGLASPLGAMLNEVGDVASDAMLYLPLALVASVPAAWCVAAVTSGWLAEIAGVAGAQIGAPRRYDGPVGKSDRAVGFGLLALLLGLGVDPGPAQWPALLLCALTAGGLWATRNRVRAAVREARPA
jgi:CDP-diacylglycerol--glycerol-3-phosphate 3-phosphatidyltransferase